MREKEGEPISESDVPTTLLDLLATLSPLKEDFPAIEDYPPESFDLEHSGGSDNSRATRTHRSG